MVKKILISIVVLVVLFLAFMLKIGKDLNYGKGVEVVPADFAFFVYNKDQAKVRCDQRDIVRKCATISDPLCHYQVNKSYYECQEESQIQWVPSAEISNLEPGLGPCLTRKFVKLNREHWLNTPYCQEWMQKRGGNSVNWVDTPETLRLKRTPESEYFVSPEGLIAEKTAKELGDITDKFRLARSDASFFCADGKMRPGACIRKLIQGSRPKSAAGLVAIAANLPFAMNKDKEAGYPNSVVRVLAGETLVSVLENMNLDDHSYNSILAFNFTHKMILMYFKLFEEKMLKETSKKLLKNNEESLNKAEAEIDSESVASWKKKKITDLRARMGALKSKSWELF